MTLHTTRCVNNINFWTSYLQHFVLKLAFYWENGEKHQTAFVLLCKAIFGRILNTFSSSVSICLQFLVSRIHQDPTYKSSVFQGKKWGSLSFLQCHNQEKDYFSGYSVTHYITHQFSLSIWDSLHLKYQNENTELIKVIHNQFEHNLTKEFSYACNKV